MLPVINVAKLVVSPLLSVITSLIAPLAIIIGFAILLEVSGIPVISGTFEIVMQALRNLIRGIIVDMVPGVDG